MNLVQPKCTIINESDITIDNKIVIVAGIILLRGTKRL